MPIFLVVIGLLLVVTGVKDTYVQFGQLVKNDFTGPNNFTYWLVALGIIGAIGYVKPLRPFSNAFLGLVVLVIVLKNGGVFSQLTGALKAGPTATPAQAPPVVPSSGNPTPISGSSSGITPSDVLSFAETLAMAAG